MSKYVTIKEFCKQVNRSPQSVYKRLNKTDNPLNNFVKLVDGEKMISLEAVKLYKKPEKEEQSSAAGQSEVNAKLVEMLEKELEKKNEQIAELTKLLDQQQQLNMKTIQELDVVREEKKLLLESKAEAEEKKPWWKRLG